MQNARALKSETPPPAHEAADRLAEVAAALRDVIEGLALVDQASLTEDSRRQFLRARAASRAGARIAGVPLATADGPLDLAEVLMEIEDRWAGHATTRGTSLSLALAPDVPRQVALDRLALDRALSALLSTAIAGTRGGAVRLAVDCREGTLAFTVTAPDRPGPDRTDREAALAAAGAMAQRLGGNLTTGPMAAASFAAALELPGAAWGVPGADVPERALEGLRVRLVPPGTDGTAALAAIVERYGGTLVTQEAGSPPPVTAVCTAGGAGLDALRAARPAAGGPLLALTPSLLDPDRAALAAAGADGVLALPLPPPEVVVEVLLGLRRGRSAGADGFDPEKLARLLDLAGAEVADELLDRLAEDLAGVATVLEAAAPARDVAALRAQTHVLISLAGAVGAERLQHLAEALNAAAHGGDGAAIDRLWADAAPLLSALRAHVDGVRAGRGADA